MSENELQLNNEKLDKANYYRKWGGLIPYLMKNVDGVRDLVYEELSKKKVPAEEFIKVLVDKFPDLSSEKIPSKSAVIEFKKKINQEEDAKSMALALKDEFKILKVLDDFNLFEERMKIYKESVNTVNSLKETIDRIMVFWAKGPVPPRALFDAYSQLDATLQSQTKFISEIDDLAIRFGLMPPKQEKNILFAQQNISFSDEHEEMMKILGLTADDFSNEKYENTMRKVFNFYASKSAKRPIEFEEATVVDENSGVNDKGKKAPVVEKL